MTVAAKPVRVVRDVDKDARRPVYAVWELTLKCNLKCQHCGSRAGSSRNDELSANEALDLVDQLADLGVRELALIGGEAYLRRDWLEIIRRAAQRGLRPVLQTGGFGLTGTLLKRAADAGLAAVGVSLDGLHDTHDRVRGVLGSYQAALRTMRFAKDVGVVTTANTQIHSLSVNELENIANVLIEAGISAWQLQLTVAMGNAADNHELLLQPYELDQLFPRIAEIFDKCQRQGVEVQAGNNIGYFGPYEHLWRGPTRSADHYDGCQAGVNGIGIEADGRVKGCPSLATSRFVEGSVRNESLESIWQRKGSFMLNRQGTDHLWGFCKTCYYADVCRGGCAWTSDSLLGRSGNNPYCHHRVITLKSRGQRERVVVVQDAERSSFGVGLFKIVEEAW